MGKGRVGRRISRRRSEIRLKNTLEVALVLDNSGSMKEIGTVRARSASTCSRKRPSSSSTPIAGQAAIMKQISKPVQFAVVPFAASVNVGPQNADAAWMDTQGISPVHHENFDWRRCTDPNKEADKRRRGLVQEGHGWGERGAGRCCQPLLAVQGNEARQLHERVRPAGVRLHELPQQRHLQNGPLAGNEATTPIRSAICELAGLRRGAAYPYNVDDTAASTSDPATLFVPMFAPDEAGRTLERRQADQPAQRLQRRRTAGGTTTPRASTLDPPKEHDKILRRAALRQRRPRRQRARTTAARRSRSRRSPT